MNFVSIILYAGSVFSKLVPICSILGVLCMICFAVCFVAVGDTVGKEKEAAKSWRKIFGIMGAVCMLIVILVPSAEVLYLIAASELGEEVVTNPEVVEVATELKNVILDKIKDIGE